MKGRKWIIRLAALLVVIGIGAVMMVIGRGHTLYFDNKSLDYGGTHYDAFHKVEVSVKGAEDSKLYERERGSATWIGQNFEMNLLVTAEKKGEEIPYQVNLTLPYSIDGIIINLPALMAGLPQEAWLEEFIPTPSAADEEGTDVDDLTGDEFGTGEIGAGEDLGTGDLGM